MPPSSTRASRATRPPPAPTLMAGDDAPPTLCHLPSPRWSSPALRAQSHSACSCPSQEHTAATASPAGETATSCHRKALADPRGESAVAFGFASVSPLLSYSAILLLLSEATATQASGCGPETATMLVVLGPRCSPCLSWSHNTLPEEARAGSTVDLDEEVGNLDSCSASALRSAASKGTTPTHPLPLLINTKHSARGTSHDALLGLRWELAKNHASSLLAVMETT